MTVIAKLWSAIVACVFVVDAVAQVSHGTALVAPKWEKWVVGEPVPLGGEGAPVCTVYSLHTMTPMAEQFAGDGDYLSDLQRRFGERGLVVVGVVADAKADGRERWPGCRIVADLELTTSRQWTEGWVGDPDAGYPWNVLLVDRDGVVRFLGGAESGLVDAIEATLAGRDVAAGEMAAFTLRQNLQAAFDDATAEFVAPLTEAVAHAPRDGFLRGLLYLVQATKANDAVAAKKVLQESLASLAGEARPLAVFCDLALRGDARRPGLAAAIKPVLHPAAASVPNDAVVQLAFLRCLVTLGDAREVGRQSMKLKKLATATAASSLEFATILTLDQNAPVHKDLATLALDKAATLGADARLLTAARYGVATRCAGEPETGKALLETYLKDTELRASINNDCWYFMTRLPTMGRFDVFAAGLADRMLEQKEGMDYFEFDTAALAMFLVGRFADAVSLQETAILKGGKGNPEYVERLQRYKQGQQPAPR